MMHAHASVTVLHEYVIDMNVIRCLRLFSPSTVAIQAFLDFADCFAINCTCGSAFCAWCLAPCGRDAHQHVASCNKKLPGGNTYFGSFELFQQAQNVRKDGLLRDYLDTVTSEELRASIEQRLAPHLRDLGMHLPARPARAAGRGG